MKKKIQLKYIKCKFQSFNFVKTGKKFKKIMNEKKGIIIRYIFCNYVNENGQSLFLKLLVSSCLAYNTKFL